MMPRLYERYQRHVNDCNEEFVCRRTMYAALPWWKKLLTRKPKMKLPNGDKFINFINKVIKE
jgi:hypothetical protein